MNVVYKLQFASISKQCGTLRCIGTNVSSLSRG